MKFLLFFLLFFCTFSFISPQSSRTIYNEFVNDKERGVWKGYSYYLNPKLSEEGIKGIHIYNLTLNQSGIYVENIEYLNSLLFSFNCNYEEDLPCSITQFKKDYREYYPEFIKDFEEIMRLDTIENKGEQCMILQILKDKIFDPHFFCIYAKGQGKVFQAEVNEKTLLKFMVCF